MAAQVSGRRYQMDENERGVTAFAFDFGGKETVLTMAGPWGDEAIVCGLGEWRKGETIFDDRWGSQPAAVSGGWIDPATFAFRIYFYETPFCITYTCRFEGDSLTVEPVVNVSFGPTEWPHLTGKTVR